MRGNRVGQKEAVWSGGIRAKSEGQCEQVLFCAEHVSAGYGGKRIVQGASFALMPGTLTGLLGVNGCGKTTLLKATCQRIPHTGSCLLRVKCREDIQPKGLRSAMQRAETAAQPEALYHSLEGMTTRSLARSVSYIPQKSGISISISVLETVLMGFNPGLGLLEKPSRSQRLRAVYALEQVGLEQLAEQDFLTLSEGQKQLVLLARTLIEDTQLLLLDEPDSALDLPNRYRIMSQIRALVEGTEKAGLLCLHDPMLALEFCDQLLLMQSGCILQSVHPKKDLPQELENALRQIYGPLEVECCKDGRDRRRLVLLWEF